MYSRVLSISTHLDNFSNIAMVTKDEIFHITDIESVQAFMLKWRDLIKENTMKKICQIMSAMTIVDNRKQTTARVSMPLNKSAVVLLKKYSDFANVFSKTNADILPEHSMYDLAIETEKGKIPPFGPVYNHSGIELQTLRDYINMILAKSFIILSKVPFRAPVLFPKKKNSGLHLCVSY